MTATYPTSRRAFAAEEAWSGSPLLAGLPRALMDWQNYTYNADLPISPSDAKLYGAESFAWQGGVTTDISPTAQRTVGPGYATTLALASVYVPPPRSPTAGVKMWVLVELSATNSVGTVQVRSGRTGVVYSAAVTYALCGSVLTGAWIGIDAEASPGDTLAIAATWTSGGTITAAGLSSYWKPADLYAPSAWTPISQAHVADDRPCHSRVARWLAESCNRFMEHRAPLQFLASYMAEWACGNTAGFTASRTTLGRYMVLVGARVATLRIAVRAQADAAARTVLVKVDGTTKHTFTVGATEGWQEVDIALTAADVATAYDVTLVWGGEAASWVMAPSVSIWEKTATFTLPGAESVPGAFVANDNGVVVGKSNVTQAQWRRLVENMVWIWSKRGLRSLVCDSRWTACTHGVDRDAPDADHEVQGIWKFTFADGAVGVPRFHVAYHEWWWAYGASYADSWAWLDEVASKASAATATRVAAASPPGSDTSGGSSLYQYLGGAVSVLYRARAALSVTSPPWVTAAAATQEYRAWAKRTADAIPLQTTRIAGVVIEQMPLDQAAGTRV